MNNQIQVSIFISISISNDAKNLEEERIIIKQSTNNEEEKERKEEKGGGGIKYGKRITISKWSTLMPQCPR